VSGRRYLTTPIYYPSGEPHLGHAYTTILGDVLARFYRQSGNDVFYLTGTDEHGSKMVNAAAEHGVTPLELADEMSGKFRAAWDSLEISYDRYIRTTEPEHISIVEAVLQRWWDKGLIYSDDYSGWYCVPDERYWTEKELGPDNTCPDCGRPCEYLEETNYFYRMGDFQERLVAHIEENPDWIVPEARRNEVLGFLQQPLRDLSISRPRSRLDWGVVLPFDKERITALEAVSMTGGLLDFRADPGGVLVLREYPESALTAGVRGPRMQRVVFTFDLTEGEGLFSAGAFDVASGDVVFVTESPITSVQTIFGLVGQAFGVASGATRVSNGT